MSGPSNQTTESKSGKALRLCLLALGVVYGDIGTSPLYALRECFHGPHAVAVNAANVLGVLSLIFWSLMLLISVKYLILLLRADNKGEGGILAMLALLAGHKAKRRVVREWFILMIGLFGAALLYGDGMITPAISVLSAIEGLEVATPFFQPYIIPITIVILVALFMVQRHGTAAVGSVFGPIMVIWFLTLAVLGLGPIIQNPSIFRAVNPWNALQFFLNNGWSGYLVLGSVFLVVTGGEALYADMGHFGPRPIRIGWFTMVLPALLINYFGQGAWLLGHPEAASNTFYAVVPGWGLYPMVVLAAAATVIASQALISGVFSLTMQAIPLGYSPRVEIDHTSQEQRGQIFIAPMNWLLMLSTVGLVLGFKSSSNLAAAYGVSVTATMVITTCLYFAIACLLWRWSVLWTALLMVPFLMIDLSFFGANIVKIAHGGWFPLVVAAALFTIATTWKRGRELLAVQVLKQLMPLEGFMGSLKHAPPQRVRGTAIFLTGNPTNAPLAMAHNLKHNKVLHQRVILLTIVNKEVPYVDPAERLEYEELGDGFHRLIAHYGFMETPNIPRLLNSCVSKGLTFNMLETTFFLGRETVIPAKKKGMMVWRKRLFAALTRNAQPVNAYFQIPPNRVIEVGTQIEL